MSYVIIAYMIDIILIIIAMLKQKKKLNTLKFKLKISKKCYCDLLEIYKYTIKR